MITLQRSRIIQSTPEEIFSLLASPEQLSSIVPRIKRVEMLERHSDHARLATYMSIGHGLGDFRCEGDLRWKSPEWITFTVTKPLPIENSWSLRLVEHGTEVNVAMALDLSPLLGPFAAFVPTHIVSDMLREDLDTTLDHIANLSVNTSQNHTVAT